MDLHEQGMSSRTFVIAAIVCVLLQAGLAPQISIAGGRVNFMIILVCLSVFSGDPTRAVVCGFCSGLFYDLSAAVPVGVMSLLLTVGSFALVHSAVGQTGGTPSARGVTVGVLLEVNESGETSKSGCNPAYAIRIAQKIGTLDGLELQGLMTIGAHVSDETAIRRGFEHLRRTRDRILASGEPGTQSCRELSMGMTGDMELAIAEGSTIVRVGTAIFGERAFI